MTGEDYRFPDGEGRDFACAPGGRGVSLFDCAARFVLRFWVGRVCRKPLYEY